MERPIILADGLVRRFGPVVAVDGLSFEVPKGEFFGILGPNGAGKTTLINLLTTMLRPTAGTALVAGYSIREQREGVRRSIGVVFQETTLDTKLTTRENLLFHASLYGVSRQERPKRVANVLELLELSDRADSLVETFSGGMKRRLEIARGLIHYPKVLFLDEPTLGLDAQTRRRIWEHLEGLNRDYGMTIVLTTHYMEEADRLCQRVAIVDRGVIVALDAPAELKAHLAGDVVTVGVSGHDHSVLAAIESQPWVKVATWEGDRLTLTVSEGETRVPEIVCVLRDGGLFVKSVNLRKPSLEDVFIHYTGHSLHDVGGGGNADRFPMVRFANR